MNRKHTPLSDDALGLDGALHRLHEVLDDRQPQAGAAQFARRALSTR